MDKISYLGPEGSYSRLAAERLVSNGEYIAYQSFPAVFGALASNEVDGAVIPIENSLNGGVLQNMDLLQYTQGIVAVKEEVVKIDHRLITLNGTDLKNVKRVYSHSQALEQCARYLAENFPNARLIATQSTAESLEMLTSKEDACIAGAHNSRAGLYISENNVADEKDNFTHFLLLRRGNVAEDKTSRKIYFSVTLPNRSGSLVGLLQRLAAHGLNMTKIESRPVKTRINEFAFFIETEGDYARKDIKLALKDIENSSLSFKLLGCY